MRACSLLLHSVGEHRPEPRQAFCINKHGALHAIEVSALCLWAPIFRATSTSVSGCNEQSTAAGEEEGRRRQRKEAAAGEDAVAAAGGAAWNLTLNTS